jgi:DNA-nicking Smr family endonuclease
MSLNPPNRRRRPAGDDLALWRRTIRDVAPLRPRAPPPAKKLVEPPQPSRIAPGLKLPAASSTHYPAPPLDSLAGIDRANAERLKRGRHEIEARLDLHGLTQSEAHRALSGFVASSHAAGHRCVLVITGRGRLGGGILRAAVPRWLAEPDLRGRLLGIAPAQPHHGGAGALYLLLRRLR